MCLAIPGKIIKKEEDRVLVDYGSERREAKIFEGSYKVGDYVIVQAKLVVDKVPEDQVRAWLKFVR